eukprot:305677-Chlamydomonas_euryale.AAC.2
MSAGLRAGIAGKESCAGMVGRLVGQGPRQGVAGQKSRSGLLNWLMCGRQGQACWTGSFAGVQGQTMSIPLAWPVQVTLGWPNTVGCRAHTVVHLIVRQGAWQPCWADSWQPHEVLMQWARAPSHPLEDPPPPQPSLAHNSPYDSHSLLQRFPSGPMPTETDMAAACSLRTGFVLATAECSCQAAAPCSLRTGAHARQQHHAAYVQVLLWQLQGAHARQQQNANPGGFFLSLCHAAVAWQHARMQPSTLRRRRQITAAAATGCLPEMQERVGDGGGNLRPPPEAVGRAAFHEPPLCALTCGGVDGKRFLEAWLRALRPIHLEDAGSEEDALNVCIAVECGGASRSGACYQLGFIAGLERASAGAGLLRAGAVRCRSGAPGVWGSWLEVFRGLGGGASAATTRPERNGWKRETATSTCVPAWRRVPVRRARGTWAASQNRFDRPASGLGVPNPFKRETRITTAEGLCSCDISL